MTASSRASRERLDALMVSRGLAESRSKAQALIMAGDVLVEGEVAGKPAQLVEQGADIKLVEKLPFVSRGGIKLAGALDEFGIDVRGLVAMDVGASTGGFTDCLLQRGVARVYAIDVGYGQLDYRLRQDPRVVVMERVNAHYPFSMPEKAGLAVLDLSFISTTKVIPNVAEHLGRPGRLVVLLKPQFEALKEEVGKGGVIKDPLLHATILGRFIVWAVEQGYRLRGLAPSPILGASGNREFLVYLTAG